MIGISNKIFLNVIAADGIDSLEIIQDALDDLWKQTEHDYYPEARMAHFLTVIGSKFSS